MTGFYVKIEHRFGGGIIVEFWYNTDLRDNQVYRDLGHAYSAIEKWLTV
jgi:hypothetical protein